MATLVTLAPFPLALRSRYLRCSLRLARAAIPAASAGSPADEATSVSEAGDRGLAWCQAASTRSRLTC